MASSAQEKRPLDANGIISIAFTVAALLVFGAFTLIFMEGFLPDVMNYPALPH
jgi:hypothetical protein